MAKYTGRIMPTLGSVGIIQVAYKAHTNIMQYIFKQT